jgi:hypothetical protein
MPRLSEDVKRAVVIFISATIIFSALAYVAVTPRPKEQFFQLYVLGETRMAERYYPDDNPNILVGRSVKWYLGATNFMGSVQYVVIKVKLGNSTIKAPDDVNYMPSPAPVLLEFRRVLMDNETWEFPFAWIIGEVIEIGDMTSATVLVINVKDGAEVRSGQVSALNGHNFRIIFELWTFDPLTEELMFGWRAGGERRVAWLQMWFNATKPLSS